MTTARWFVYLIECRGGSLYTGITNDVEARYQAHVDGRGAKYTRAFPPRRLIGFREFPDRGAAARAECAVKRLDPKQKLAYIQA